MANKTINNGNELVEEKNQVLTHKERLTRRGAMARMVKSGKTVPQVAIYFGVTVRTVHDACEQFGVTLHRVVMAI